MSSPNRRTAGFSGAASAPLEDIVERFESAWQRGERPAPDKYLPPGGPLRRAVLHELVCIDLEYRCKVGEPVAAETYLERYPELRRDLGVAVDLILAEWELRCQREGPVPFADYARRLRQLREAAAAPREPSGGPATTLPAGEEGEHGAAADGRTVTYRPTTAAGADAVLPSVPGYEVLEELGQGGMGVVYRARQVGLNRLVALKMIAAGAGAGPDDVARFRTEAESAARLQHPNIVQVFEVGEYLGRPFFSMEYADGGSLEKQTAGVPQPWRQAAVLVEALARAMHYAHQRGVLHRDLKPANVLLAAGGLATDAKPPAAVPKVADFGLAKQLDDDTGRTRTGMLLGTPSYMAPEQASGRVKDLGPWTDTYALGTILYELLTGRVPFKGASVVDTLDQVRSQEVVPPRRLQPRVPRDLETVCLKCLEKDPRRRYATAEDLAEDLRRFLAGEPIRARPVGAVGRGVKWVRRQPVVAALSALLVAVALLGFGLVAWKWREASAALAAVGGAENATRQAEERAQAARATATHEQERAAAARTEAERLQRGFEAAQAGAAAAVHRAEEADHKVAEARTKAERFQSDATTAARQADSARAEQGALDYANHVAMAARELQLDNVSRAAELLLDCPEGRRGWEWLYLQRLGDASLRTLGGHQGPVTSLAFSPDGTVLVSAGADRLLKLWDPATGANRGTLTGHTDRVSSLAFSREGVLASGSWDRTVRFWDVKAGRPRRTVLRHDGPVLYVAFTPREQRLVTASAGSTPTGPEGQVRFWAPQSGAADEPAWEPYMGRAWDRPLPATWVGYAPDSRTLIVARQGLDPRRQGNVGSVQPVPLAPASPGLGSAPLPGALGEHPGVLTGMALSPDGKRLASASLAEASLPALAIARPLPSPSPTPGAEAVPAGPPDRHERSTLPAGEAKLWDLERRKLLRPLPGYGVVQFSPDGRLLALAGRHHALVVWDVVKDQEAFHLHGHDAEITSLAFSPDSRWLASGDSGGTVKLWAVASEPGGFPLRAPAGACAEATFAPDGRRLAVILRPSPAAGEPSAAKTPGEVRVCDLPDGREAARLRDLPAEVLRVAFSADGRRLATASKDGTVDLWDATTGAKVRALGQHAGPPLRLSLSPDGRRLVLVSLPPPGAGRWGAGRWGAVRVWDLDGAPDRKPLQFPEVRTAAVHFGTGRLVVVAPQGVRLRDLATGEGGAALVAQAGPVLAAEFSPDGRRLATAGSDGTIVVWSTKTGKALRTLRGHTGPVTCLAFRGDGTRLASGGQDQVVRVWDPDAGTEVRALPGHAAAVSRVAFSPDPHGRCLLSASQDEAVRLWDPETGRELQTLEGHPESARTVAFSPDGTRVASASWSGTVKVWDAGSGQEVLALQGPTDPVAAVSFSPDGRWLLAVREGGTLTLWDARPVAVAAPQGISR